ncbi:unnamed protein product [Cochlearia groenlandica]
MDDENKKKKRNKKKKNKQNNNKRVDEALPSGVATSEDGNRDGDGDQISQALDSNDSKQSQQINVVENASLEETIKLLRDENGSYLQKEAVFEETVRRLETENASHIQKEALLEERLVNLRTENESHIQNEGLLEGKLLHLRTENESHIQNEALLEERLLHLKTENESHIQNEEKLEERLVQYKTKNDVLVHEMSSTEVNMRQMLEERSTFTEKEASLENKVRQLQHDEESAAAVENSSREMISTLNNEISRLQVQVIQLEEYRSTLLEQNQSLEETVSNLQVQHRNNESNTKGVSASEKELNSQIDAAFALIEKLITENAELVEKVNELCIKLNQSHHEGLAIEVQKSESLEEIPIHDELIRIDNSSRDIDTALTDLSKDETEETVPVSLNPNGEIDVESQVVVVARGDDLSHDIALVDSPLIGAPFRLVSFVARYVSGADLAQKK